MSEPYLDNPWGLTQREFQVMSHRCHFTMKELARELGISYGTANDHVKMVHRKMDVHRNTWACIIFDRWRITYLTEAIEDYPVGDPRIKLLREDLGFELHKRAPKSPIP